MDTILNVKDLRISFRTSNGKVQAVRGINFDLEKGKTLAIVGESGSGKSVTSKAILGIQAGNAITESGEIIYDGMDLLKIPEEEFHNIRGDKIAMIFQDPLSSLNPIVKIGRQITEAMLLKNKTSRREARKSFNKLLDVLRENITLVTGNAAQAKQLTETFDKFCIKANQLEQSYNDSCSNAELLAAAVEDFLFKMSKKQHLDVKNNLAEFAGKLSQINDPFFTARDSEMLKQMQTDLRAARNAYKSKDVELPAELENKLKTLAELLKKMTAQPRPNFFRIGFYALHHPNEQLAGKDVAELNEMCLKYLDENFMKEFLQVERKAVERSFNDALTKKKALLDDLSQAKAYFSGDFDKKSAMRYAKELSVKVKATIDPLEIKKDSVAYTFESALDSAIEKYFMHLEHNPKEEKRFEKQTRKHDKLVAKGKQVEWKVAPKVIFDMEESREEILSIINRLVDNYDSYIAGAVSVDFQERSVGIIDHMKELASKVVYKVNRAIAKEKAIKLMEEVGIAEPRMRYNQYPFEFSGGMRQRIVIAIALSADPEILICDEPTTALDVTIQAQILELINNLKRERNLSVIFITHDLGVVANMADDIAVMYAGKIVEYGTADEIFYDPRHPYTWALLSSMPDLDTKEKLDAIPGTPPNMIYPPVGDAFADRNKYAMQIDFEQEPPLFDITETHKAATWLLHPDAPKVEVPKVITDRIARMKKQTGGVSNEQ